jgi:hypothetical protein
MKLDRTSHCRVLGALSAALFLAHQSHAQPAAYPTVTDQRLEHPDAGTPAMAPPSKASTLSLSRQSKMQKLSWSMFFRT